MPRHSQGLERRILLKSHTRLLHLTHHGDCGEVQHLEGGTKNLPNLSDLVGVARGYKQGFVHRYLDDSRSSGGKINRWTTSSLADSHRRPHALHDPIRNLARLRGAVGQNMVDKSRIG